jgi:CubicO group peptidase (beta-lactamase class C family)
MDDLEALVDEVASASNFSGVVRIDRRDEPTFAVAFGLADRAWHISNTVETRFAIASGSKGFTALAIVSLIEEGVLDLATTARTLLGDDLPLIDNRVTVENLLAHRSGIGDYLDEDEGEQEQQPREQLAGYPMSVPVQELARTEQFLPALDGHPQLFEPGTSFHYCNGGYVVLALIAERASGTSFHDLVRDRVCRPAGMVHTEFLRSDELPGDVAIGYLATDGLRTNVFHLPIRGNGDGGIYSTAEDIHAFWESLYAERIVSTKWVTLMTTPHSHASDSISYGLGFWLHRAGHGVRLEGSDAGVSFRSVHDPRAGHTHTVIANDPDSAWPVSRRLIEYFSD